MLGDGRYGIKQASSEKAVTLINRHISVGITTVSATTATTIPTITTTTKTKKKIKKKKKKNY